MTFLYCRRSCWRVFLFIMMCSLSKVTLAYDWSDGFNVEKKEGDRYGLILSPYTYHFDPSDEHKHVWLIGIEREREDFSLAGISYFSNSFGQPSAYISPWGKIYRNLLDQPQLYAKLTAGLLYGYRGKYEDKVPLNYNGFSPAIVPALGWETAGRFQTQINFLGLNAIMLQLTFPLR